MNYKDLNPGDVWTYPKGTAEYFKLASGKSRPLYDCHYDQLVDEIVPDNQPVEFVRAGIVGF